MSKLGQDIAYIMKIYGGFKLIKTKKNIDKMKQEVGKLFKILEADLSALGLKIQLSEQERDLFLPMNTFFEFDALEHIEHRIRDVILRPNHYCESRNQESKEYLNYFDLNSIEEQKVFLKPFFKTKYQQIANKPGAKALKG